MFTLFIEFSLKIGNTVSFIVPKPLLNNENYKTSRDQLLHSNLIQVVTGSNIFDNAGVESCIFLTSHYSQPNSNVKILKYDDGVFNLVNTINQNTFLLSDSSIISTEIDTDDIQIIDKLKKIRQFDSIFEIKRGVEAGKKDDSIVDFPTSNKVLRGQDVELYNVNFCNKYILFDDFDIQKFKERRLYSEPKILIRRVSNQIIATYDREGYVVLNTLYCVKSKQKESGSLLFYTGIFNSRLVSFWFTKTFCNTDKLFPYIRTSQLKQLPIPTATPEQQSPIIALVDKILAAKRANPHADTSAWEREIDGLMYELYGLTEDEVKVVEGGA